MKTIFSIIFGIVALPAFGGSVLNSLKQPMTQVQLYSGAEEVEKLLKEAKGDNIILPASIKVTQADIEACKNKCKSSKGIFAQGIDCEEGCTPQSIEKAILMAAKKEWERLKKIRIE